MMAAKLEKANSLYNEKNKSELLHEIVTSCLWHEPHSLMEIIRKTGWTRDRWKDSRHALERCICWVLREAISHGYIRRERGLFLLTVQGRIDLQKGLDLDDSMS